MTSPLSLRGPASVPAPRRSRGAHRSLPDDLALLAQAVDVLSVRVAVAGGLATGVRARALGLHLVAACTAVREHVTVQRDVVLPVLGATATATACDGDGDRDGDGGVAAGVAALRASAGGVLAATVPVSRGAGTLLEQAAGVGVLQELGVATRALWSAAVEHERAWGALAAPRARRLLVERRRDAADGACA